MLLRNEQGAMQHRRACDLVGGLLQVPGEHLQSALDAGCGQGFWAREVAHSYPSLQITGIDSNEQSIQQAYKASEQEQLQNVIFHCMNILHMCDLPQFDLVFARYLFLHLPCQSWLPAVESLKNHVRPGGYLQLIDGGIEKASTPAWQELLYIFEHLMRTMGQNAQVSFSFTNLLVRTGLQMYRCTYHPLLSGNWEKANFSPRNALARYTKARPFIEKAGFISLANYDDVLRQAESEIELPEFLAMGSVISAIGHLPEDSVLRNQVHEKIGASQSTI